MSTRIPSFPRLVRGAAQLPAWGPRLPAIGELWRRSVGIAVTDHRTSWVRRLATPAGIVYAKTYEYETWAARLRDFARRTRPWSRSRAAAEFDALVWMQEHGQPAPQPIGVLEWRRCGFLCRATLLTADFGGAPASATLRDTPAAERAVIARAIGNLVGRLHALGFRDRNLDLRNLIVRRDGDRWTVAKIDSPRHRLLAPGLRDDPLARADWARLLPQLDAFGLAAIARDAADQPSGQARSSSST